MWLHNWKLFYFFALLFWFLEGHQNAHLVFKWSRVPEVRASSGSVSISVQWTRSDRSQAEPEAQAEPDVKSWERLGAKVTSLTHLIGPQDIQVRAEDLPTCWTLKLALMQPAVSANWVSGCFGAKSKWLFVGFKRVGSCHNFRRLYLGGLKLDVGN